MPLPLTIRIIEALSDFKLKLLERAVSSIVSPSISVSTNSYLPSIKDSR